MTGGNAKRTKMTPSAGQWKRGRERGTEDREKGVGSKIFPAQTITQGRVRGQEYSCLNYLTPSYPSPPPPTPPTLSQGGGEERGQPAVDPWTRGEGKGGSNQPTGPSD